MSTIWNPWDQFNKKAERLPIDNPPCGNCLFYTKEKCNNGGDMEQDFSCFTEVHPAAPRCSACRYWYPHRKYIDNGEFLGITCCTYTVQKRDFSCFEEKEKNA